MSEKIEAKSMGTSRREFIAAAGAAVAGLAIGAVIGSQAFPKVVELAGVTRTETKTATVTAPGGTTTVTAPGAATTVTAPGATTTVTAPGAATTTTTTITAPAATTTVTVAAAPVKYPLVEYCTTPQGINRDEAPAGKYLTWNAIYAKCTGCELCVLACVRQHYGNVVNPELSRVQVSWHYPGPMAIPTNCWNCEDTPCVKVCPVTPTAISKDPKKLIIKVDKARCLGYKCGKCMVECKDKRADAIHFYPPDHDYAIVCDQCDGAGPGGEPEPQCTKICGPKVFEYWTPLNCTNISRSVRNAKQIAEDLAQDYYPITKEKRMKYPSELGL